MISPAQRNLALALLLGALSVVAYAPFDLFPLLWVTLGGLFLLFERADGAWAGARLGAAFGLGFFLAGVSWVYVSLHTFGGMAPPLAALATFLFCALLSLYPALAGFFYLHLSPPPGWRRIGLFAALWMLGEWLRGWILTGFPWLATGYAQTPPSPLAGYTPVLGVYGVSLLTAFLAALLATLTVEFVNRRHRQSAWIFRLLAAATLLAVGALLTCLRWTQPTGDPVRVALLQGNVAQELKWRPERFEESLRAYYQLAQASPAQLTILPETALPAPFGQLPPAYLAALKALAEGAKGDLVFGSVLGSAGRYFNGAVSLGISPTQTYGKSHLVPFGEFIPPGFSWFLALAHIPMSDFSAGKTTQRPLAIAGQQVAINICYEDAFGEEIIRTLPEATLLVNLSNVAWFGDSLAPAQHLQIARVRALESGRFMLRATNTGMTAIVAPDGRVQHVLPPFTRAALTGEVRAYTGSTPYARWGNLPAVGLAVLLLALCARIRRSADRQPNTR